MKFNIYFPVYLENCCFFFVFLSDVLRDTFHMLNTSSSVQYIDCDVRLWKFFMISCRKKMRTVITKKSCRTSTLNVLSSSFEYIVLVCFLKITSAQFSTFFCSITSSFSLLLIHILILCIILIGP